MIKVRRPLQHPENYGVFNELIGMDPLSEREHIMEIRSDEINKVTYKQYFQWLINFMVDGIETPLWHGYGKVHVMFIDGFDCNLTINDFLINMILWYIPVEIENPITSEHLYWEEYITNKTIAKYINKTFVDVYRGILTNRYMNNVIADCTGLFAHIDKISKYLSDSINFYDDIKLMEACPEYYECLHLDISHQPLDKVRQVIDENVAKAIDIINHSNKYLGYYHSLASNFMSEEGLNKKQFGEVYVDIGTKPDINGDVIPYIISRSYMNGGVSDFTTRMIDSLAGRIATVISHKNVSESGSIAKRLVLGNIVAFLHPDSSYKCNTRNFIKLTINNSDTLIRLNLRYYKETPNGVTKKLKFSDVHLIGKTIYLYSPMTCASFAAGKGCCYRCYGDLAYINKNINIGIFAANELANEFTQRMLSAKHLLETVISIIKWCDDFDNYFSVDIDQINVNTEKTVSGIKILIRVDDIQNDDDSDEDYDEDIIRSEDKCGYYITEFIIQDPRYDEDIIINSSNSDKIYFTKDLYRIIDKMVKKTDDEYIVLDVDSLDSNLFTFDVDNAGLNKALVTIQNIIDKVAVTSQFTKDEFLQNFIDALNASKIKMNSVHPEIILANQIRSKNDILNKPAWEYDNPEYTILSLRQSLSNNPSLMVSLAFQNVANQLNASTLTARKTAPSQYDLMAIEKPQEFLEGVDIERVSDDTDYNMSVLGMDEQVGGYKKIDPFIILNNNKN